MGYGKITAKQQEILDYIKDEILKRGYPPTVREICETVNLKVHLFRAFSFRDIWRRTAISAETPPSPVPLRSATTASRWCVPRWSASP